MIDWKQRPALACQNTTPGPSLEMKEIELAPELAVVALLGLPRSA